MRLSNDGIKDCSQWKQAGYEMPEFSRERVKENTVKNPFWIHFGAGNIFRAFQANVVQGLLNKGILDRGLIVAEGYDYEIIEKMNRPTDDLSILVTLKADGNIEKTVVGSVVESLVLDREADHDFTRLQDIFTADSLQMVSFTITEKGYRLVDAQGKWFSDVELDMQNGPENTKSYIGKVVSLLYKRYRSGSKPIAMVSMDNCSHNGDKLYTAVDTFATEWYSNGLVDKGFVEYVENKDFVSFPWSMIDKITPRPDTSVYEILKKDGIDNLEQVITKKNTYVAPFVNAEECQYLVIEDAFPNGRPELTQGGILFTDRETVDKVEKMKVCTCLNPLHTALAIYGCLLGYNLISKELEDPTLKKMVEVIGYKEGLPVVVNPGVIDPKQFIDEVVNIRIPNPFMPDTPQRIATDTSQKLGIRFGETIKAYLKSETLDCKDLKVIPLVFAGWLRYLMAIDDEGKLFPLSSDPMLDSVCGYVKNIKLGDNIDVHKVVEPILSREDIFGMNLYTIGMGELVEGYFTEMITGPHAIKKTLQKYV